MSDILTETQTRVDFLNGGGPIAQRLLESGFNVQALRPIDTQNAEMRTQGTLRKEEWLHFDNTVVEIARDTLRGVQDLMNANLSYNITNALGHTKIEWETQSDMSGAELSMAGVTAGRNDRVLYDLESLPLPIVHKDFQINIRALSASRNNGNPLDTTQVTIASRKVSEYLESMVFSGDTTLGASNTIYGYTNATNRTTGSVTASWLTATGEQILSDVLDMIQAAKDNRRYGPYYLYVPEGVETRLNEDFKANSDKSIMSRLMEIPSLAGIRGTNYLSGTNIVLVQLTREVVDMINGFAPTTVQWESNGGMTFHFKVMAIMVPRIKDTYSDQSGIVHFS